MSNIIPFDQAQLPAYLKAIDPSTLNADLTAHAGGGFPVISIKGKVFAIVRDGERSIIPNPKDPESAASSIEMVIIKANKGTSKVFYAKGYTEGAENVKPDCFSNDGTRPDASVEVKQCATCAACPKNAWGSKVTENGKKGKACSDSVRLAVATPDMLNDPYMIRVPAASIRNLGEYGNMLKKRGVGYTMVVTKIGFDIESPTPLLTFKPVGFLPAEAYEEVKEMASSDVVQNILGSGFVDNGAPAEVADVADEQFEQAAPAAAKVVEKAKAAAPKIATKSPVVTEAEVIAAIVEAVEAKAPEVKVTKSIDIDSTDFDNLGFDD